MKGLNQKNTSYLTNNTNSPVKSIKMFCLFRHFYLTFYLFAEIWYLSLDITSLFLITTLFFNDIQNPTSQFQCQLFPESGAIFIPCHRRMRMRLEAAVGCFLCFPLKDLQPTAVPAVSHSSWIIAGEPGRHSALKNQLQYKAYRRRAPLLLLCFVMIGPNEDVDTVGTAVAITHAHWGTACDEMTDRRWLYFYAAWLWFFFWLDLFDKNV